MAPSRRTGASPRGSTNRSATGRCGWCVRGRNTARSDPDRRRGATEVQRDRCRLDDSPGEVARASPPCRALDYGKWRYEEERKLRASLRIRSHESLKEVQLRPKIGSHDYAWKRDRALEFLRRRIEGEGGRDLPRSRARASGARSRPDRPARGGRQGGRTARRDAGVAEGRTITAVISPTAVRP